MQQGHYARYIRKMRRIYAKKLACLQESLNSLSNQVHLKGLEAGLHAFLEVREDINISQLIKNCATQGLVVRDIQAYGLETVPHHGLILGFGALSQQEIINGVNVLKRCVK